MVTLLFVCLASLTATTVSADLLHEAENSYQPEKARLLPDALALFYRFITDYKRQYADSAEWNMRYKVFREFLKRVDANNAENKHATFGNLESVYAIKANNFLSLSEQQLVDCDSSSGGCKGGLMDNALNYYIQAGGAMLGSQYPYEAKQLACRFDPSQVAVQVRGCNRFQPTDEDQLRQLLVTNGLISACMAARPLLVSGYQNGIFAGCKPTDQVDHAVLLVGYGSENGVPYWTIKNSWGLTFGESGYLRLHRGSNQCGMETSLLTSAIL